MITLKKLSIATVGAVYVVLATAVNAQALAILNNAGFNANTVPRNDDGSAATTPIGFELNFFGRSYSNLYVNNNGNVTFNASLGTFTPFGLTSNIGTPIIAPFFADVDTRGTASNLVSYGTDIVDGRRAFGVNYINVGYFPSATDKLNSFQSVLIDRSDTGAGNFDIQFNYDSILWETGGASGGTNGFGGSPARVGYSNGTGSPGSFAELAGSGISRSFLDSNTATGLINNSLNSNVNGRYNFTVRGGIVTNPPPTVLPPSPPTEIPFEFSPGLGLLVLGAWGTMAQVVSKVQKWKSSGGALSK